MNRIDRYKILIRYIIQNGFASSQKDLGQKMGYTNESAFSQIINERVPLPKNFMAKLKTFVPDLNINWVLTGEGNMLVDVSSPMIQETFTLRTDHAAWDQRVPLYELDATAGLVSLFDDTSRQIPINYLQIPNLPPCDGALYVRGDSMYPLLKSGDIVLYKETNNGIQNILWGEMYLLSFTIEGETFITIKYIQRGDDANTVKLVSHNPHHSPKDIPADSIRALALVKASVRFNTMG